MRNQLFDHLDRVFRVLAFLQLALCAGLRADARILEVPLALSADARSEFTTQVRLLSPGRLVVELVLNQNPRREGTLSVSIFRPDRSEAARKEAAGSFRLEYQATEPEIDQLVSTGKLSWSVRVMQGGSPSGEVLGRLRSYCASRSPAVGGDSVYSPGIRKCAGDSIHCPSPWKNSGERRLGTGCSGSGGGLSR